jgi:carbamoyl-phosphate synthase large subunit
MREMNILITAASRRVALIQSFVQGIKKLGINGNVITTDMNPFSPGLYFSDRHYMVPLTTDRRYIPIIRSICFKERIRLLIPTIDDELPLFGAHAEKFLATGVRVAVSSAKTGTICNDKQLTYRFLSEKKIPMAKTWLPSELEYAALQYPLFLKPRNGRGSVGAHTVDNERQLRFFLEYVPDPVVQEYLPGREFTIDVLADFNGRLISAVPRERMVIRSGVSDRGRTMFHQGMIDLAIRTSDALEIRGPANIQVKLHEDKPTIFEVNPRFAGGIPLTLAAGADFPTWLIEMACGRKVRPCIGKFTDGLVMSCFESAVFLPEESLRNDSREVEALDTNHKPESLMRVH